MKPYYIAKRVANDGGFTIVEVMVAFLIMVIGFTFMLQLVLFMFKANIVGRDMAEAKFVAEQVAERIRSMDYRSAELVDDGDTGDLDDIASPDYEDTLVVSGTQYRQLYNIADGVPYANVKTVRIFILWNAGNTNHSYAITTYKGDI